jgi:TetR/AcrR family transcriptional regulator, transcriptional repressor for nem operon
VRLPVDLREKIIQESLKLFSLKGFLSTSIHDVLEAAGTSKGGLYNHFLSKEDLFFAVLGAAQEIWRQRILGGLDTIDKPVERIKALLHNYSNRYLKDTEAFPGGCVFVTLSVELDDQRPRLSQEITKGFVGFKKMLNRWLDEAKTSGEIQSDVDTKAVTEMIFAGMLGTSVIYGMEKSLDVLDKSIETLIAYLETLSS